MAKVKWLVSLLVFGLVLSVSSVASAANFSVDTNILGTYMGSMLTFDMPGSLIVTGYNKTHGFSKQLHSWLSYSTERDVNGDGRVDTNEKAWIINYCVPDDGSEWEVIGSFFCWAMDGDHSKAFTFNRTHVVSGTFTGVSIGQAVNAANSAKSSADAAKTSADTAKTEAINAKNAANNAAVYTWDATESKSAATLAKEARDKANAALTEINNVKTTVNNIQASVGPVIQKVATANAATCTQGTSIPVIVQASGATEFRARADTGSWTAWTPVGSSVTVTGITGTGPHVIYVEARNSAGTTATGQLTVFKL